MPGGKGMAGGQGLNEMVHHFITSQGIDERAADALRSAAPAVQEYVLDVGIAGARNPSSALLARMREAKTNVPGAGYGGQPSNYGPEFSAVEGFIRSSGVDERAAEHLRQSDPQVQGFVLDHGVTGARNPSSALIALIRDAKMGGGVGKSGGKSGARGIPLGMSGAGNAAVEQFLKSNEIDSKAAEALRSAPRSVQDHVIEKGLKGARNPSSVVLARIRDAKAAGGDAGKGRGREKRGRSRSRSRKRSRSRSSSSSSSSSSSTRRSRKKRRRRKRRKKSGSRNKSPSQKKLKPKPEKPKAAGGREGEAKI